MTLVEKAHGKRNFRQRKIRLNQHLLGTLGSRLAHDAFEALMENRDREVPLQVILRRPTSRVRRVPRWLIEDGRDARAHNAFG